MPAPPINHHQVAFGVCSVVDNETWVDRFDWISASFCTHERIHAILQGLRA